jgi:hypothetical protein
MTAEEALRKARITAGCRGNAEGCEFQLRAPNDSEIVAILPLMTWGLESLHRWQASALLDGFTVEELTAAGG